MYMFQLTATTYYIKIVYTEFIPMSNYTDILKQTTTYLSTVKSSIYTNAMIGLFHLISVPPLSRIHVFNSYTPEEFQA